jgi:hypothetical protein
MLWASPWLKLIISAVVNIVRSLPSGFSESCVQFIREAASDPMLTTNDARFKWVYAQLQAKYPSLPRNAIEVIITSLYGPVKTGQVQSNNAPA